MPKLEFEEEELPEVSGDTGSTVPNLPESHLPEAVPENKVPHNLLKTPRGVNPAKRAGFYANEKPEVLGKTLEESSGVPKGAVFPVVETTPETVFVEWGTRPPESADDSGTIEEPSQKVVGEGVRGLGVTEDFILKEGIAPLDRVADAEVEVFYSYNDSVEHEVVNLKEVDFSLHSDILLVTIERLSGSWSLRLIAGDNTFTLKAQVSVPQGQDVPTGTIFTYVKVTIPSESKVVSKLPSECIEGMPLVVNCSIEHCKEEDFAVFDKTFAEMQNYELDDIQFRFNGLKCTKQLFEAQLEKPSFYLAYFYDIQVNDDGLVISQTKFELNSLDVAGFTTHTYNSSGVKTGDEGSGKK